ncbi:MAG: hypothetical protein GWP14_00050 [Actinobacteria bacterium]|nr:hypothetical protein [Actinomycetota bacterium]
MAKKVTKKAKPALTKAKSTKTAKARVKKTKAESSAKQVKCSGKKPRRPNPSSKSSLKFLSTGAGAKLNGKMGSAGPVTKTAPARKNRRKGSPLSAKKLAEFRDLLLQRRKELLGSVSQMRDEALKKNRQDAAGNLSKFPTNPADLGSDNYELEFTLSLLESEQELLREIDDALKRIDQKVYGICEGTGEAIPQTRLKFEPWTRYTVEYANMLEKGLVHRDEVDELDETKEN